LLTALRAGHTHFNSLFDSGNVRRGYRRQSIILGLFTGLATFGFVSESFIVKEDLLADGPHERLAAIDAGNRAILKVRRWLSFDLLRPAV
jgi:hypothetical protein